MLNGKGMTMDAGIIRKYPGKSKGAVRLLF